MEGAKLIVLHCFLSLSDKKAGPETLGTLFFSPPAFLYAKYRDILEINAINSQAEENNSCEQRRLQRLESNGSFSYMPFQPQLQPVSHWHRKERCQHRTSKCHETKKI